ncbi:MAG: 50S ribosomal protein L6 [Candidatus Aenigmatarchaeota archaeon]
MERTIEIPNDVQIEVDKFNFKVKGPKGNLEKDFYSPLFNKEIVIKKDGSKITISSQSKKKKVKAMMGTIEAIVTNMMIGVKEAYVAKLKIVYMHFPFTVKLSSKEILVNNFLGEKSARKARIVGDCKVEIQGDEVTVTGISKEDVGQTTAQLERVTHIKNRDRRVFQDGIFITKKP